MHISKLYRKRIIAIVVLGIMLVVAASVTGEFLRPFSNTDIYNKEFNEMKNKQQKVDMVFVGNSRTMFSLNPIIFQDRLGLNKVYNLSMGGQCLEGYYYCLKEFIEVFHPDYVVMDLERTNLTQKYANNIIHLRNLKRLHGENYWAYIRNVLKKDNYVYLIPCYAYRSYLNKISDNVQRKLRLEKEGLPMKVYDYKAMGNGFYTKRGALAKGNVGVPGIRNFDKSNMKEKNIYYLNKCVQLCRNNDVKLIFLTAPTSMADLYTINNYEEYVKFIAEIANNNNIKYHNLYYHKDKERLLPDNLMADYVHINEAGSTVVSRIYADILYKELHGIDAGESFYKSLDEVKKTVKRIVGVDAKLVIKNDLMSMTIKSLQNEDVIPEYEILLAVEKNNFKSVVGWTKQKEISFEIPKKKNCRILLRARRQNDAKASAWMAWKIDMQGKIRKIHDVPAEKIYG